MPSTSQAQRAYLFATKGEQWTRAHGFANRGKLPERARPKKKHDKKAFVEAFAAACVRDGLAPAQVAERAKALAASVKRADTPVLGEAAGLAGNVFGGLKDLGVNGFLLGSVGLPAVAGTLAGAAAGHLHNQANSDDLDAQRRLALARAYRRRADDLAARREADRLAAAHPGKYVVLG